MDSWTEVQLSKIWRPGATTASTPSSPRGVCPRRRPTSPSTTPTPPPPRTAQPPPPRARSPQPPTGRRWRAVCRQVGLPERDERARLQVLLHHQERGDPRAQGGAQLPVQDQRTASKEDFPSTDSLQQSVVKVEKQVTGAPLGLSIVDDYVDVAHEKEASPSEKKECNYRNGKWVSDNLRPLYSGFGCKQWLSESWACRLTQRTDFAYEKIRWQPEACEMPEFEASQFLRRYMAIGHSLFKLNLEMTYTALFGLMLSLSHLGRQMFQSMMCMVTGGKEQPDVEDVGAEYGFVLAPGAKRPDGWAYRFPSTNTTILYHWSSTHCDLEPLNPSDPATSYAMHLDRPPSFVKNNLCRFHVLVLNTGHHWNRGKLRANKWEMYLGGALNNRRNIAVIWKAKNFTIHSVVKWLDAQLHHHPQLKVFYRSISPRHFFNGDWNTGGRCDNTSPLAKGSGIFQNHSDDADAEGAVKGTKIKLLDITALSRLRDEGHISQYSIKASQGVQDCLHWCLPGVPDTWNEILAGCSPAVV